MVLIKCVFYVNISYQALKIQSIQSSCTTEHIQTIQSIWFSFQLLLRPKEVNSRLSTLISFFEKLFFFCFFVFAGCFSFNFIFFVCFGLIWFFLVLVIFSWFCYNFLLHGELIMISNVSLRWFVRLTNLGTFK